MLLLLPRSVVDVFGCLAEEEAVLLPPGGLHLPLPTFFFFGGNNNDVGMVVISLSLSLSLSTTNH
jgi:hypothetical protein